MNYYKRDYRLNNYQGVTLGALTALGVICWYLLLCINYTSFHLGIGGNNCPSSLLHYQHKGGSNFLGTSGGDAFGGRLVVTGRKLTTM